MSSLAQKNIGYIDIQNAHNTQDRGSKIMELDAISMDTPLKDLDLFRLLHIKNIDVAALTKKFWDNDVSHEVFKKKKEYYPILKKNRLSNNDRYNIVDEKKSLYFEHNVIFPCCMYDENYSIDDLTDHTISSIDKAIGFFGAGDIDRPIKITLSGKIIPKGEYKKLCQSIMKKGLPAGSTIDIKFTALGDRGLLMWSDVLATSSTILSPGVTINFGWNQISNDGIKNFCNSLIAIDGFSVGNGFDFATNKIGDRGMQYICTMLKKTRGMAIGSILGLADNQIGDSGVALLIKTLKEKKLPIGSVIDISNNNISSTSIGAIDTLNKTMEGKIQY